MKRTVQIYATFRIEVQGVDAQSDREAIEKSVASIDARSFERQGDSISPGLYFADEFTGYHVDPTSDPEFTSSRFYDKVPQDAAAKA